MPVHDVQYFSFLRGAALMPGSGPVLSATAGGAGNVVLGTPMPGAVYDLCTDVDCYLHLGGPATQFGDLYVPAKVPRTLVFCNEDHGGPDSQFAAPSVNLYFTGSGHACAVPLASPNFIARAMALGLAETGLSVDAPRASGGRQGITFGAEAATPPSDAAVAVKVSP